MYVLKMGVGVLAMLHLLPSWPSRKKLSGGGGGDGGRKDSSFVPQGFVACSWGGNGVGGWRRPSAGCRRCSCRLDVSTFPDCCCKSTRER